MQHTATWMPTFAFLGALRAAAMRAVATLRRAIQRCGLDADERYLQAACDLPDLERRQRCLERGRGERFAPLDRAA